jgi:hypothetical protein
VPDGARPALEVFTVAVRVTLPPLDGTLLGLAVTVVVVVALVTVIVSVADVLVQ